MSATAYDVVVIGGGPVGENVADRAVQGGLSAVIVEAELVGGECSYWACMPTKALLRDAAALRAARSLPGAAAAVTGDLDTAAVLARRDRFATHWHDDGQVAWLQSAGIDLVRGHGRLLGGGAVEVTGADGGSTVLTARHAVVVATGTTAALPPIAGLAEAKPWTSREAVSAERIPARLAMIGGGVVGAEMASAYSAFGTEVTLIARDGLLPRVEAFARDHLAAAFAADGVRVLSGAEPVRIDRDADGTVRIALAGGETVEADEVLVATGRTPNTGDIGLEAVGLAPGGWLPVDETLRVVDGEGIPVEGGRLYAVGDVNHRALLTHQGKYQARAAGDVIVARATGAEVDDAPWGRHAATADHGAVPQVIFTHPEIVAVGHTVASATEAGLRVRAVEYDLAAVAGAFLHADGYTGRAGMLIDEDAGTIVGFTAVGPDTAELAHAATIAIAAEVPIERLWHAVPAYPTVSELWLRLLETAGADTRNRRTTASTTSTSASTTPLATSTR
ncbi:NAD(P)/FAD-dependent oxidoreductase [Leifsonia sp. F6_8S_P_1B]|uniref:NAD(P)/FAD-dependent oxidoreductase n=1 Tax=Leifsonia williamsii TaxID=3035919 RepID=A0ABT8K9N1_9MICO|nr:NAD(P)/FAD-dependent oxidoreductase [Leifsonia williamsii]MDN4613872.1 NAD(P)/FAD-dependent oxidoreductase [Leifsonia williamsii]